MPVKDWFDDFMDYKLSGCEGNEPSGNTSGCLSYVLGILAVIWAISKLFY